MPNQLKLRTVANVALTHTEVDRNFSSVFYDATQEGNKIVLYTTGSTVQAASSASFNVGLGLNTTATGPYSHAEGYLTTASGDYSHAEGDQTKASGNFSHAEGYGTLATGT